MHQWTRARSDAQADGPSPTGYPSGAKVGTLTLVKGHKSGSLDAAHLMG